MEYNPIVDIFVEDESMKNAFEQETTKEENNMNETTNNVIDLTETAADVSEETTAPAEEVVVAETAEMAEADESAAEETTASEEPDVSSETSDEEIAPQELTDEAIIEGNEVVQGIFEEAVKEEANGAKDNEEYVHFARETKKVTAKSLVKMLSQGKFVIPDFQRMYVWSPKQKAEFEDSMKYGYSCGEIAVVEYEDKLIVVDGYQRMTTISKILADKAKYDPKAYKAMESYMVTLEISKGMNHHEMKKFFTKKNNGTILASVVKARADVPEEINDAVLRLSSHSFFREMPTNVTFAKSHHHELIAMNALLAVTPKVGIVENKAKSLCKTLDAYSSEVMEHVEEAVALIDRISGVYSTYKNILKNDIVKRSMSANFISSLIRVIHDHEDVKDAQIALGIAEIFAKVRTIPEYAQTTASGGAALNSCKKRDSVVYKVISRQNPDDVTKPAPAKEDDKKDESAKPKGKKSSKKSKKAASSSANDPLNGLIADDMRDEFAKFDEKMSSESECILKDSSGEYMVDFRDLKLYHKAEIFNAMKDGNSHQVDLFIQKAYRMMEAAAIK